MSGSMHGNPVLGIGFVLAQLVANFGMEDFGATAGHAAQPRVNHLLQDPFHRLFRDETEPADLDGRPSLDMNLGTGFVQDTNDIQIPVEFLLMM